LYLILLFRVAVGAAVLPIVIRAVAAAALEVCLLDQQAYFLEQLIQLLLVLAVLALLVLPMLLLGAHHLLELLLLQAVDMGKHMVKQLVLVDQAVEEQRDNLRGVPEQVDKVLLEAVAELMQIVLHPKALAAVAAQVLLGLIILV
jgi:hypothetical protein